jgi:hypothetical protein
MWIAVLIVVAALVSTCAQAQTRPSTVTMTCAQAARLVTSQSAIVLGTGGSTFDRFVTDRRFCALTQTTEPAWVPASDNPQCFVGYRCKEPTSEHEGNSRD